MSCEIVCSSECEILAVELLTGPPGTHGERGEKGDQGEQGPAGSDGVSGTLGNVTGDISQTQGVGTIIFTVVALQGFAVKQQQPTSKQALIYNGAMWEPVTITAGSY